MEKGIFLPAFRYGWDSIETLAELGADVRAVRNDGATPVHLAAENGHFDAIEALVELGADAQKESERPRKI
jgi:ankyrin repeat protein